MNNKKQPWVRLRHTVITFLAEPIVQLLCKKRYRLNCERSDYREQCVILYNHQTPYDQFFVGMSMRRRLYYVATEDIFSIGFLSRLLEFAVAPIPIKKSARDLKALKICLQVVKEGGSIAIAPEGNRTYSGHTCYIKPAIAALVQKLGLPLVIYRIEGGYGVEPRWSDEARRGIIHAYVRKVIQPEEYKALSKDEFIDLIRQEMYVNEGIPGTEYPCDVSAEYMERAFYTCPSCGLTTWRSSGETAACQKCRGRIKYLPNKEIVEIDRFPGGFPYKGTSEWYKAQEDFMRSLDLSQYYDKEMYRDKVSLSRVVPYENKVLLAEAAEVKLYGNRIGVAGVSDIEDLSFKEIKGMSCMGRNKLNIYMKDDIFQVKGDKRFNPVKYVHTYYHYEACEKGENNDEFLGL